MRGYTGNGVNASQNDCAVMLVWDKMPNKALPAITDILDSANARSMNKRENASRFVILRRWDYVLTGKSDGSTVGGYVRSFDKYVRLPRDCVASCTAGDTTGVIANRISGALYLVTVGVNAAGNTAALLNATIRVNFEDI